MLERVAATIERHRMFAQGDRAGVAVSGGADSVCLLDVLRELAPRWNLSLTVLHLDHCLRGEESDADAAFVREMAARLGLPFIGRRVDVAALPGNLEQAARQARLDFFRELAGSGSLDRVALGHTKSDQAETVLFRLLRGAGSAGLAGIRPVTEGGRIVRPLIGIERGEVAMYLGERGIGWREDSTNRDPSFSRNRIRHQLLPQLGREWNPAIVNVLARTADRAREEEDYWTVEIDRLAAHLLRMEAGAVFLSCCRLDALPTALQRRLLRRAIGQVRGDLREIDFDHVEAILGLALGPEGHGRVQAPGIDALRSFEWLRIAPPGSYPGDGFQLAFPVPGAVGIPGGSGRIITELIDNSETRGRGESVYNNVMSGVDWNLVSGPLRLRNWRPGDAYRPAGQGAARKLKDLFQQGRVPLWERRGWPVVEGNGEIVWTRRFGPAAHLAAGPATRLVLDIREEHPGSGIGTGGSSV